MTDTNSDSIDCSDSGDHKDIGHKDRASLVQINRQLSQVDRSTPMRRMLTHSLMGLCRSLGTSNNNNKSEPQRFHEWSARANETITVTGADPDAFTTTSGHIVQPRRKRII